MQGNLQNNSAAAWRTNPPAYQTNQQCTESKVSSDAVAQAL